MTPVEWVLIVCKALFLSCFAYAGLSGPHLRALRRTYSYYHIRISCWRNGCREGGKMFPKVTRTWIQIENHVDRCLVLATNLVCSLSWLQVRAHNKHEVGLNRRENQGLERQQRWRWDSGLSEAQRVPSRPKLWSFMEISAATLKSPT